jgi:hypothetical protein
MRRDAHCQGSLRTWNALRRNGELEQQPPLLRGNHSAAISFDRTTHQHCHLCLSTRAEGALLGIILF